MRTSIPVLTHSASEVTLLSLYETTVCSIHNRVFTGPTNSGIFGLHFPELESSGNE